jgi:RES domain-containing protein
MDLWRISIFPSLDGEGGRLYPGRWNSAGLPVVYLAASAAGALIEVLVHLDLDDDELPRDYTLLRVSVPSRLRISSLNVPSGEAWKSDESITRKLGDTWLAAKRSSLARAPSAILPGTFNYLLNPLHPDASRLKIAESQQVFFDQRLLRKTRIP